MRDFALDEEYGRVIKNTVMKHKKLHKREKWRICKIIWNEYLIAGNYLEGESNQVQYDWQENVARKIIEKHPEISVEMLKIFEDLFFIIRFFNWNRRYSAFEKMQWTEEISKNVFRLSGLARVIENVLLDRKPKIINYKKPQIIISPPSSAYKPIPFNKMDIIHSKSSYARLFAPYI